MIIWGAQECEQKATASQMKALDAYLGPDYVRLNKVEMWEMFLVCCIHKRHIMFAHSPQSNFIPLGVMNLIGNKGALML